ncbi:lachesin-like [Penaeus indicus]|uniref:lachesin-like n=1 Tax=Penaeus indicus TaxID=29960 RepID=UPI00300C8A77
MHGPGNVETAAKKCKPRWFAGQKRSPTGDSTSRVGWLKVDSQTILSLQKRVVTHNTRISVTHDEHRTWNLHIKQVKESDRGCYMCQINTPIMKNGVGCIEVHVPPDIMNDATSTDTTVHEGETVRLRCEARGYPPPEIRWKREDGQNIILKSSGRDGTRTASWLASEPYNRPPIRASDQYDQYQFGRAPDPGWRRLRA